MCSSDLGWIAPQGTPSGSDAAPARGQAPGGALLAIGRELVEPTSMPEFERLQQARSDESKLKWRAS